MRARDAARYGLAVVAWLFVGCIVVQVFLAGLGVFDGPGAFITHREFGYTFGWLTIVMVVLAAVGRMRRGLVGLTALTVLMFTLQSVLIAVRADYPLVAALHPINGMALLFVSIGIVGWAWAGRAAREANASPASPSLATDTRSPS